MNLNNNINNWVAYDNKIKHLQKEINDLREKKNVEENNIIHIAKSRDILHNNIKFNDGIIKFHNNNKYTPLTLQYIKSCLNDLIEEPEQVDQIIDYIKEQRTITSKINIKYLNNK